MLPSPAGPRIVTLLDEAHLTQLLHEVAQRASGSSYRFSPHPASPLAFMAAPYANPAVVEAVADFRLEPGTGYTVVAPSTGWLADTNSTAHPAVDALTAEFRYAVAQVDPSAYELPIPAADAPPAQPVPDPVPPTAEPVTSAPFGRNTAPPATGATMSATSGTTTDSTSRPSPPSWRLLDPAGLRVPLLQHNVLGRSPDPSPALPRARLIALNDPAKTLSKTHALLEVSEGMGWVTDLKSTNGTQVIQGNTGEVIDCPPKRPVEFMPGDVVRLGALEVTVWLD